MARSQRGGYQKPSKPAATSGPGALSQRTDGGSMEFQGLPHGDNKAINDLAASAPLAQAGAPGAAGAAPRRATPQPQGPDGIFGPTERPDEPLTAGVDWGAGAGSPGVPTFPDDPNYQLRAIAAENDHLADYLLGLADA